MTIEIVEVGLDDKKLREQFIRFPWKIYQGDPVWVPPLLLDRRDFLKAAKNPWWANGKAQLFLARRGGEWVGRIAGIHDVNYNRFQESNQGFWGLFECVDDQEVADALFDAGQAWVADQGLTSYLGPMNFNTNQDCGLLIDGFEDSPLIYMTYNPRYYPALCEGAGFEKAMDVYSSWVGADDDPPKIDKIRRVLDRVQKRHGVTLRNLDMKNFDAELERIFSIYNSAWEKNWGFVPFTRDEFEHLGADLKMVLRPELCLIAEIEGEPVAFSITILDANQVIQKVNGKLFPLGIFKLLWGIKFGGIDRLRLLALGIKEGYRRKGLESFLLHESLMAARQLGYTGAEVGWTLETNDAVNRLVATMGGKVVKTYRFYERPVTSSR